MFNGLHDDPNGPTFEERDRARPVISNLFDTFVAVSKLSNPPHATIQQSIFLVIYK